MFCSCRATRSNSVSRSLPGPSTTLRSSKLFAAASFGFRASSFGTGPGGGVGRWRRLASFVEDHGTVWGKRDPWGKGNLPVVAVRVGEIAAVPAPKSILSRFDDGGAG